jgi:chorismate mutase
MHKHRKRIDRLDRRVARLLCRRYRSVRKIGLYKLRQRRRVAAPHRERSVLSLVEGRARDQGEAAYLRTIYRCIFEASRAVQDQVCPEGDTTHDPSGVSGD